MANLQSCRLPGTETGRRRRISGRRPVGHRTCSGTSGISLLPVPSVPHSAPSLPSLADSLRVFGDGSHTFYMSGQAIVADWHMTSELRFGSNFLGDLPSRADSIVLAIHSLAVEFKWEKRLGGDLGPRTHRQPRAGRRPRRGNRFRTAGLLPTRRPALASSSASPSCPTSRRADPDRPSPQCLLSLASLLSERAHHAHADFSAFADLHEQLLHFH